MIEINQLTRTFWQKPLLEKRQLVVALEQVTFDIEPGTLCVVTGPNGSGKTTLLRLVAGLLLPTSGEILIHGHPPISSYNRGRVGFLSSETNKGFYGHLSAWENIRLAAGTCGLGLNAKMLLLKAEALEEAMVCPPVLNIRVRELPQGLRSRLALIRTLICEPEILVLDEPFRDIDQDSLWKIKNWFQEEAVRKQGKTILFTTHRLEEFSGWSASCVTLKEGRLDPEQYLQYV